MLYGGLAVVLAFNFCAFSARSAVGIGDSFGAFLDGGGGRFDQKLIHFLI